MAEINLKCVILKIFFDRYGFARCRLERLSNVINAKVSEVKE